MYIDNKVYKQLINSKTPEELWNNKSLLSIDSNIELDKDDILIRTLSLNEYNKYVVNSTCDGSIVKYSNQVWQYKTKVFTCFGTYTNFSNPASFWDTSKVDGSYPRPGQDGFIGQYSGNNFTMNVPVYGIMLTNNTAGQATYYCYPQKYLLATVNRAYDYVWSSKYISPSVTTYSANKNYTNNVSVGSPSISNAMAGWGGGITVTVNLQAYSSFVPVFNYVDNNKSDNIYY